jgi:hypothetical protein
MQPAPMETFLSHSQNPTDGRLVQPEAVQFSAGHAVRVAVGKIAGLEGIVRQQTPDGRCLIELADVVPGIFLRLDSRNLVRR